MEADDKAEMSRREFLAWAGAIAAMLALPGCGDPAQANYAPPPQSYRARRAAAYASAVPAPQVQTQYIYVQQAPVAPAPAQTPRYAAVSQSGGKVSAMSRNSWGATAAVPAKMKAMNGVTRITIHHEGSAKPNNDSTAAQVSATLRLIQSQHRSRMGAGDIGYHFIIDRTGAIWQGRDWKYQGAHTSGANSNNLGVMLLGNFELQQPTGQQVAALQKLVRSLVNKYGLNPAKDIFGHSDFCNTKCPGKNLKPQVAAMRRSL